MNSRLRNNRGFTLIEVLVATVLMGIFVVGFLKLQASSVTARAHAKMRTTSTQIASDFLDQVLVSDPANPVVDGSAIADAGNDTINIGTGIYTRTWTIERNQPVVDLMRVTITTSWSEKGHNSAVTLQTIMPL